MLVKSLTKNGTEELVDSVPQSFGTQEEVMQGNASTIFLRLVIPP